MTTENFVKKCGCHYNGGESEPWYICEQHFHKEYGPSRLQALSASRKDSQKWKTIESESKGYKNELGGKARNFTHKYALNNPLTKDVSLTPTVPRLQSDHVGHYWLYAIRLEGGNFYIGMTSKSNPYHRIRSHSSILGAKWTIRHRPLQVYEVRDIGSMTKTEAEDLEHQLTLIYMRLYGYNKVRGGKITYSGRIFKVGNMYLRGNLVESLLVGFLLMICALYIVIKEVT